MESNEEIFGKLMSDKVFRELAIEHLLGKVYERLKRDAFVKEINLLDK